MSSFIENIPFVGNLYKQITELQTELIQSAYFFAIGGAVGAVIYFIKDIKK